MPAPYSAAMPGELDLEGTYTIRVTAVDPTTGAVVPGVEVSDFVLTVQPGASTSSDQLAFGQFLLVPGPGA